MVSKNPLAIKYPSPAPAEYTMTMPVMELVRFRFFMMKYTAIMDRKPGNRFMMMAMFIRGLRALKRMQLMA